MSVPPARTPLYLGKDRNKVRALVSVPMSPTEWRKLRQAARRRKIALSRFIREAALHVAALPADGTDEPGEAA